MDQQLFELGSQLFEQQLSELRSKGVALEKPQRSSTGAISIAVNFIGREFDDYSRQVSLFWPSYLAVAVLLALIIWMQWRRRAKMVTARKT